MPGFSIRPPYGVAAIVFLFTWTLTTHGKYSASGDEPHYLMVAESLRTDGDLNVDNNYRQNDGRLFGHDRLPMELHAIRDRMGEVHSVHAIGLPVLVLPVYVLAQRVAGATSEALLQRVRMDRGLFAYSIVTTFLIALASIGLALLAAGLGAITTPRNGVFIAVAIGVSPPVVSHAFLIFPEVVALFVTCCAVWFATKRPRETDRRVVLFLAFALGALPWFHQKYFVYSIGLLLVIAWRRRDVLSSLRVGRKTLAVVLFLAPQVALLAWLQYEWGTVGGALTTGVLTSETIPLTIDTLKTGAVGLWFDRQAGLLAFAPLYWIVPACWVLTWRRTWEYGAPMVLLYLPAAAFVIGWWAGFSPAARYLAPSIPLLTVPLAHALQYASVRRAAVVVLLLQIPVDAVVWQHPRWLWPAVDGNRALQALGLPGRVYEWVLVPVQREGVTTHALVGLLAVVVVTTVIVASARRELRPDHLSR